MIGHQQPNEIPNIWALNKMGANQKLFVLLIAQNKLATNLQENGIFMKGIELDKKL